MKTRIAVIRVTKRLAATLVPALLALAVTAARAGTLAASILDQSGKPVEDAVLTATPMTPAPELAPGSADVVVDQIDKTFVPYVTAVRAGTQVRFPNSDNIRHHVYSFSPAKKFELPLYKGSKAAPVVFDKSGTVVMGCNIHDWMVGYVYVAETPYFGKSGADGIVQLRDLPAGRYTLRVWHPEMEGTEDATARSVTIDTQGQLVATWTIARLAEFRPRRAPVARNSGYY
jgi:plastocyanin